LNVFFQATSDELLAIYFIGTITAIIALRTIDRKQLNMQWTFSQGLDL
jgi:hypothetical protein